MIGVKKIAHATYETPDLDQQIEYYTDILGLNLIAQGKGRRLSRLDASIIIRWCCAKAASRNACGSASSSGPTTISTRSRSRPRRTASRRRARRIPSLRSPTW